METEGLVLSALSFQEHDFIITLFTKNAILKLFVKGKKRLDAHLLALISPFTVGSFTYTPKRSDLNRFIEGKVISQNLKLRDRLASFEAASAILKTIYATQWQNKEVPSLYLLTKKFLEEIPKSENPKALIAPFLIKLLKHEGILDPTAFENPQHIEAIAKARSFESLSTVLPDEELSNEIQEYYNKVI